VAEPRRFSFRYFCFALAVFGSLIVPNSFATGLVPLETTDILNEFGLDEEKFGFVAGGVAVLATVLGITAAFFVPRFGAFRVCLAGYAMFGFGVLGLALLPASAFSLVFGVITAWGMAYLHLGNTLVVQLAPHRAGTMTNLLHALGSLGKALGPAFALIGAGWRAPFMAIAGLALTVLAFGLFGRIAKPESAAPSEAEREAPAGRALRQPFFWVCAGIFVVIVGMEIVVIYWLPHYLKAHAELGKELKAARVAYRAQSTILWSECAGRLLASVALLWIRPLPLLVLALMGTMGILVGTELQLWSGPQSSFGMICCGVAFSAPWPTLYALGCRYFPEHKGLLAVMSGAMTSCAFIVFSAIGGLIGKQYGLEWTLRLSPMLGAIAIVWAVVLFYIGERRLRSASATPA